jgi:porin
MGSVIYAPDPHVQKMPFFFNAAVHARGIFASRPVDTLGLGVVYGRFSENLQLAQQMQQQGIQNHEAAIELTYRCYFHSSAVFVQPDFQYIIQPGGTGHLNNAVVLGAQFGTNF